MNSSLRENALAVRTLTPAMYARAQAYLFASAGLVGALGVVLPHPERFHDVWMLAVQGSSVASAILLFLFPARAPRWFLALGPYAAAVFTSIVLLASGDGTSPYLLFYLWVAFYAFYFLPNREATWLALFTIVNYAAVLVVFRVGGTAEGATDNEDVAALVLTAGTIACSGVFILLLRKRVGRLIDQLSGAASTDH